MIGTIPGADFQRLGSIAALTFAHGAVGLNMLLIGKAAPLIAADLAIALPALAPAFFAQQLGLVAGAIGSGAAAARWGRRELLTVGLLAAGLLGIGVIWVETLAGFTVLRLLTGVGLGLVGPALVTEAIGHTSPRGRSIALSTVLAGNVAGAGSGFVLVAITAEAADWRHGFALAGAALIAGGVLALISLAPSTPVPARVGQRRRHSMWMVFAIEHRRTSLLLGGCFMLSMATNALLATWFASYFHSIAGISAPSFARIGVIAIPSAIIGMLGVGVAARLLPRSLLIGLVFGGHALALALVGALPFGTALFIGAFAAVAALQAAGQGLLNLMLVEYYPDALRTSALGGAAAIGRVGGLAAPWLGLVIFDVRPTLAALFIVLALVPLLVGLLLGGMRLNQPHLRRL